MNKTKKIIAGALALCAAASSTISAFAATEHWNDASTAATEWNDWKTEWETIKNNYEYVSLTPGADETKLNFAWYSKTQEVPSVRISTKDDMSNAKEFKGVQSAIAEEDAKGYFANKATVSGLSENTEYYYQVFKNSEWSAPEKYVTKSFDEFSVLYVGDPQIGACSSQTSSEGDKMSGELAARNDAYNWNKTLETALLANPDVSFMISAGDQVNTATHEYEYAGYLYPEILSSLPVATTIGNHDSGSVQYSYHFNNPNSFKTDDSVYAVGATKAGTDYYYTYGDVLFIVLDTNNYNTATHKSVIEKAVSENPDCKWRVVTFHQDIYGSGLDHSDSDGIVLRTQLTPIFDEFDIDVVLQGHDHTYSRTYQLSGDGNEHRSYDNTNYKKDDNFLTENNCYTINSDLVTGTIVDPKGTVYMEANSATGSKFYNLIPTQQDYIAERSQTWTPSYSVIDFTETTLTITTYDASTNKILEGSSAYTIVKKADSSSLRSLYEEAKSKLSDGNTYTEESINKLKDAIKNADKVLEEPTSTSEQIAEASAYLAEASGALTVKEAEDNNSKDNDPDNSDTEGKDSNDKDNPDTGVADTASKFAIFSTLGIVGIILSEKFTKKKF